MSSSSPRRSGVPLSARLRRLSSGDHAGSGYESTADEAEAEAEDHFLEINERPVDDISMEIFYKPHTISLLCVCIFGLTYTAFTR